MVPSNLDVIIKQDFTKPAKLNRAVPHFRAQCEIMFEYQPVLTDDEVIYIDLIFSLMQRSDVYSTGAVAAGFSTLEAAETLARVLSCARTLCGAALRTHPPLCFP